MVVSLRLLRLRANFNVHRLKSFYFMFNDTLFANNFLFLLQVDKAVLFIFLIILPPALSDLIHSLKMISHNMV